MELYIHIPFCVQKCLYCDFLSGPASREVQKKYMQALMREIRWRSETLRGEIQEETVTSVYIGGGTPTVIEAEDICRVMETAGECFSISGDAEISMEANPGTLTQEKLLCYSRAGINRLSIGLQSADDEELARLGRIHSWADFLVSYRLAREAGFDNINIDLMSSLPGQTMESYGRSLRLVAELSPEHISAYSLIVEEGTPFYDQYANHPELLPDEEEDRRMYAMTEEILGRAGYRRYEISNYAKPGRECRHNIGYWIRTPYLGLGLGASSLYASSRHASSPYDPSPYASSLHDTSLYHEKRFSNTADMKKYLTVLSAENTDREASLRGLLETEEDIGKKEAMEEFMFLGLRLTAGIREADFLHCFGQSLDSVYGNVLARLTRQGFLRKTEEGYRLSRRGIDVSNRILAEFIL